MQFGDAIIILLGNTNITEPSSIFISCYVYLAGFFRY